MSSPRDSERIIALLLILCCGCKIVFSNLPEFYDALVCLGPQRLFDHVSLPNRFAGLFGGLVASRSVDSVQVFHIHNTLLVTSFVHL
jgi:hypothetical protein